MIKFNSIDKILSTIYGQFTPSQLSARLFIEQKDLLTPEKYLVWFHERFHYLQSIFTSYGHLKWASYRTVSTDIIEAWINLTEKFSCDRKIPISEYLNDESKNGLKIASTIWMNDKFYQIYSLIERGNVDSFFTQQGIVDTCPTVNIQGKPYRLRGLDIFESFAKFEEAMLSELITGKSLDESIDPKYLNKEYYSTLFYFVVELGPERLIEFPIACELALSSTHIPSPQNIENLYKYAPNWRFVKIVEILKNSSNLPLIDFLDNKSFFEYTNAVLSLCGYEAWDEVWDAAETYAKSTDLTMGKEMADAIKYKKENPWMLSYPMCNFDLFVSEKFNRFEPYFTIVDDGVMYNVDNVSPSELIFENHLQALACQICGNMSKYCMDAKKLMCGYSYMGLKTCPNYLSGECDGYIDFNSVLPEIKLDKDNNIISGCTFELVLNIHGTSIRDISLGIIRKMSYEEILDSMKKHSM